MTAVLVSGALPVGCVLRIDTGVAVVLTDHGVRRAGYGARLLAAVARDRSRAPEPGDWVRLRSWPGSRTTLEECLTRPPAGWRRSASLRPGGDSATVLELPGSRR